MADTITVKQLAGKAGMEARVLRKLLRSQFPRQAKGKLYEWQPDDPQIDLILKAMGNHNGKSEAEPKAEKPKTKKAPAKTKAKDGKPKAAEAEGETGES